MAKAAYIDRAPKITIEHKVACIKARSGGAVLCWHLPLEEFRIAVDEANQLLAKHDTANIVPFRRH